ncbi:GNAT family N-acetyltransferase [Priestia megaterium]
MEVKVVTTEKQLEKVFEIWHEVFVNEQNVSAEVVLDGLEGQSTHFLLYKEGIEIGAGRIRVIEGVGKIERICILSSYRKGGSGKSLIQGIENFAREKSIDKLKLHAQIQAVSFYERLGYATVSNVFTEANILHVVMVKTLSNKS